MRTHSMDPSDIRQLEAADADFYWETYGGRDYFEEPWYWTCDAVPEDPGDYEEPWHDVGRRERMAQAIYEC